MPKPYFENHRSKVAEIIRVNHAGEYGAKMIYEGQMLGNLDKTTKSYISNMLDGELVHLEYFDKKLIEQKIRPTVLLPVWHISGYLIGRISAIFGARAAMLVTEAIEEIIEKHYADQLNYLKNTDELELTSKIELFRKEEIEHKNLAITSGSQKILAHNFFAYFIGLFCRISIYLSKKI